ncbi:MAG: 3-deoxy-D-manno-octulosonic acid transferase [Deltaproteobacteria bacterium]|nr:3-deoxy-D-manno-octulosonic acid transferase [Deltaproteobacteria bacterium]MBI3387306.1 3-deoxy-D-manno-octulosonic acid transferase [Deltaproteobacteria bacterium]
MSRLAYDALGAVVTVVATPVLPVVALTRHGSGLGERLGVLPESVRALAGRGAIWIHAASVGEVHAAAPLIEALHARQRGRPILVTTTSRTGREQARGLAGVAAAMLLPVDIRWIVARVVRFVAPSVLVIVETEIWPALLHAAADAGVPVVMVSGCISDRSVARFGFMGTVVGPLMRDALARVTEFGMQTAADADRMMALGAPPDRVRVTGSLKYARLAPAQLPDVPHPLPGLAGRPLLIAASTQPGEEQVVIEACAGLWSAYPDCVLLLAPRRPERFDEVDRLLQQAGVRRQRRSDLGSAVRPDTQAVLLDSVGELAGLLPTARAVFVGGTLAPLGGHNVLEPAAAGVPVCFGPCTENVAEAATALLVGGGATLVHDANELRALWRRLLADEGEARAIGARALAVVRARAAVIEDTVALVERALR